MTGASFPKFPKGKPVRYIGQSHLQGKTGVVVIEPGPPEWEYVTVDFGDTTAVVHRKNLTSVQIKDRA